jgi:nucleoid-associated protein YgaU
MIDRRVGPAALLVFAAAVAACLPEAARPGLTPLATAGSPTPSPGPTGPTPVPSFVRPTPTPLPPFTTYVVKSGDSLTSIARKFKTTGRSIAYWNRVAHPSLDPESAHYNPNSIRRGWVLVLIPGVVFDENSIPQPTDAPEPSA